VDLSFSETVLLAISKAEAPMIQVMRNAVDGKPSGDLTSAFMITSTVVVAGGFFWVFGVGVGASGPANYPSSTRHCL
jgi:hypothetical protein